MRTLLLVLLLVALFSGTALWYQQNPGVVEMTWLGHHLEMSIAVFIAALIVALFVVYTVIRFIMGLLNIPNVFRSTLSRYHLTQGLEDIEDGFTALYTENPRALKRIGKRLKSRIKSSQLPELFLGHSALLVENYDDARLHFLKLTQIDSMAYMGYYGLARISIAQHDQLAAISYLDHALTYEPNSLPARYMLLNLTVMEGQFERSLKDVNKILKTDPDNKFLLMQKTDCLIGYADHLADSGLYSKSLSLLKEALALNPDDLDVQIQYVQTLLDAGKSKEAQKVITKIWETIPNEYFAPLYTSIRNADTDIDRYKVLQDLFKVNPDDPVTLILKARYATKARLWGPAHDAINALIEQGLPQSEIAPLVQNLQDAENQR